LNYPFEELGMKLGCMGSALTDNWFMIHELNALTNDFVSQMVL
jgi:hypothetical protein